MSMKPHYFKIGLFVIAAVVLVVAVIIIFGAGLFARHQMRFESYFSESITGLSVGAPLEFRGVRIGRVEQIGFVGNVYDLGEDKTASSHFATYVRVVSSVSRDKLPEFHGEQVEVALRRMIDRGLRVRVSSNILTGLAYLEANYVDPNRFPVEDVPWEPIYFRIPSAPSELTTLKDSIDSILSRLQAIDVEGLVNSLNKLFNSLNQVISDANVPQLSRETHALLAESRGKVAALDMNAINTDIAKLLASADRAVADANVPGLSREARDLIAELRVTNQHLKALLAPPEGMTGQPNLPEMVEGATQTFDQMNGVIAHQRPEMERILFEFQQVAERLNELILELQQQPSNLLFSKPPRKSEVLK
jgi:ABC-type transporter Mla subunit MlaD